MSKEIATVKTYTYTVYTREGCEVTDTATGMPLITAEPGKPNCFPAMGDSVTVSDDAAIVFKPVFKCALAALGLLGEGSVLPPGYTRLEFLEGTGTQYIDTQQNAYNLSWELKFQVAPSGGLDAYVYNGVFYDTNTVQAGCINDPDGRPFLNVRAYGVAMASYADKSVREKPIYAKVNISEGLAFLNEEKIALGNQRPNLHANFLLFARSNEGTGRVNISGPEKIFYFNYSGENGEGKFLPALDPANTPCLYDIVNKKPCYNRGSGVFVAGVGTVGKLSYLLKRLPANGGELTLSLPAEANTPEIAAMLTATSAEKGWTLSVHEYRPAEAAIATYARSRVREVVWCRRELSEDGSYIDAVGRRWQVERCSAIFAPDGSAPTAYGYEPFDSVEQAAEHWQLVPYEAPEEENLNQD